MKDFGTPHANYNFSAFLSEEVGGFVGGFLGPTTARNASFSIPASRSTKPRFFFAKKVRGFCAIAREVPYQKEASHPKGIFPHIIIYAEGYLFVGGLFSDKTSSKSKLAQLPTQTPPEQK